MNILILITRNRNKTIEDIKDDDVVSLCDSFSKHNDYLKGIHINCKYSKVGKSGIDKLIESIEQCKSLASLGLDFGGLTIEPESLRRLNTAISNQEEIISLALGFHKVADIENDIISEYISTVEKKKDKLKMLRLNFSNTNIDRKNLLRLNDVLKESSIVHLELFLGGNDSLDNDIASKFLTTSQSMRLRGFEFDAGYSTCTGEFLASYKFFSSKLLKRCAFYLNG